jgi:ankyrin repeat protein
MSKQLGSNPNLEHLREQAKDLLANYQRGQAAAAELFQEHLPSLKGQPPTRALALHDAQSVVARQYGFDSWPKLVAHVEKVRAVHGITDEIANEFVDAALNQNESRVTRLLELYPGLPRYSAVCALATGERELVASLDPNEPLGFKNSPPLAYVVFSCVQKAVPEREAAMLECARDLLDRGADPNGGFRWNPNNPENQISILYGATGGVGSLAMTRLLLERGANPNDEESVHHSAEHDREEILQLLVDFGADLSSPGTEYGNSPVYFLCSYRETYTSGPTAMKGIHWLLEHGADPNVSCGDRRETPLHYCCRRCQAITLIEDLLAHGANPAALDGAGNTPYQLAMAAGNRAAADLLRERGAERPLTPEQSFFAACAVNDTVGIDAYPGDRLALATDAEILMKQFAELGQPDGLRGLLYAGFPVVGALKTTPLHDACYPGWLHCVDILLEHGAPVDARDDEHNSTPFGWAVHGSIFQQNPRGNYPEVIRRLIDAGTPESEINHVLSWPELRADIRSVLEGHAADQ